ncbi:glycosyltransferase family 9 protein [Filimonas effusa]|uniref:Glycosyltransferase family 9 protein n=1 Tax=Filimonas effusa TaxID=2508721 RepID=A0A4Q1D5R4_9BACT|nr:glycosyltransferase family 9 protein [Filimonas effusa]RXK83738.1 glycosyltransferase family 9 protein [Filimonas effusa]
MSLVLKPNQVKKIAIFRALQLGDLLCAIPAVRALRKAYPRAQITLIGLPWAVSLLQRFPGYFDDFIHFPGFPGLPEQPFDEVAFLEFEARMQFEQFDLLLQMQGSGTIVNPLLPGLNAKYVAGFHNAESRVDSSLFVEYPQGISEVERHLVLMDHLGIPSDGNRMEFPVSEADWKEAKDLCIPVTEKSYVIIHPGSRGSWRQWPPQCFALMADYCIERGYTAVITGTEAERDITTEVLKCMRHPAIDLTGTTSLGVMGALISDAFMLVANCTGVSHIAAATQTPSVIISMDGEPERWGPINKALHTTIDWTKEPHLELVLQAVDSMLNRRSESVA